MEIGLPYLVLDDKIPGCEHFKWSEVLYCPQWKVHVYPDRETVLNLILVTSKLDWIRKHFGCPIRVTSGLRPPVYNKLIGGAKKSCHLTGRALDFQVDGYSSDRVRQILKPLLERLDIRMERMLRSNWIHIDTKVPAKNSDRYFYP